MRNACGNQQRDMDFDRKQVETFLTAMFEPSDLIEIRAIETWTDHGKKHSRPIHRTWLRPHEVTTDLPRLEKINRVANIFFGVNPRTQRGGTKNDVALCRTVWIDIDNVSLECASERWRRIEMLPTIVVDSGHGVHAYWKLTNPVALVDQSERSYFESIVKGLAKTLSGDATHDCSRLLRLPGTWNMKDVRNGQQPLICKIVSIDESQSYPLSRFEACVGRQESTSIGEQDHSRANLDKLNAITLTHGTATIGKSRDQQRIQGILRYLDRDVPDRSRRDHGALVLLIQVGLSKAEVYSLVMNHSKFLEAGDHYFERTFNAAQRSLGQ